MKPQRFLFLALIISLLSLVSLGSASVIDVTVEDQTLLSKGHTAYLLFYQKVSKPYPDFVTIFDLRVLNGNQGNNIFYVNTSLVVAAEQQDGNTWTQYGHRVVDENEAGNFTLTYDSKTGVEIVTSDSSMPSGTVEMRFDESLPATYGPYTMSLARSNPGGPRVVVPGILTTQPIGETVLVSLSPNEWYLSVSTTIAGFGIGDTVEHSLLPGNEVAVQLGGSAVVTGSLFSGFTITVNYY